MFNLVKDKLPKRIISVSLILITLLFAVYYFSKNTYLLKELKNIPIYLFVIIFLLFWVMLLVLSLVFEMYIRLAHKSLKPKENILLNAYSQFINFFVPGQSGPIVRGYYMKKKKDLKVIDFTLVTLIYFFIYAFISLFFIILGSQSVWISLISLILISLVTFIFYKYYLVKKNISRLNLSSKNLFYLFLATLLQVLLQALIYYLELHSINHGIKVSQVITYTGAANLALFVALTPGAIGVRELFLVFTQKLHHVPISETILANTIDRSVFIVFLLSIGIFITVFKVKDTLKIQK